MTDAIDVVGPGGQVVIRVPSTTRAQQRIVCIGPSGLAKLRAPAGMTLIGQAHRCLAGAGPKARIVLEMRLPSNAKGLQDTRLDPASPTLFRWEESANVWEIVSSTLLADLSLLSTEMHDDGVYAVFGRIRKTKKPGKTEKTVKK